jgi:nicotinate phosphoribosyltransferase
MAARASFIAGFNGTSNVEAAQVFGIPAYGTMAHSFVQIHDDEAQSFERFAKSQPNNVVLLIDTYDTEAAARKVVALAQRLRERGVHIRGVRLDSGDLTAHAFNVRRILDEGGCADITIFCSGSLDEHILADMMCLGAPVDGFGVGTSLDTSKDSPALDCAYKLVDYAGIPRRKRAEEKATLPGRKQVYRCFTPAGQMHEDLLTVEDDTQDEVALIRQVMSGGQKTHEPESLTVIRERAASNLSQLPAPCRTMKPSEAYPVRVSRALQQMVQQVDRHIR